jgi:hypothetical protein
MIYSELPVVFFSAKICVLDLRESAGIFFSLEKENEVSINKEDLFRELPVDLFSAKICVLDLREFYYTQSFSGFFR